MLIPVILSGGAGTRLWPVSRQAHPKPFMRLVDGESLAEKTLDRALQATGARSTLTVTARDYFFLTRDIYNQRAPDLDHDFILEPLARNTAPAIALAAFRVRDRFGPDTRMLVLPADHLVRDQKAFDRAVAAADSLARQDYLVCLGIQPTHPETGYGYIRCGVALGESGCSVRAFVEKPDLETARGYVASGEYLWNAGMFCFRADTLLAALKAHAPEIHSEAEALWVRANADQGPVAFSPEDFATLPADSIDYAVMERAENRAVVPCDIGWSDIGSWRSISELYETDGSGNRVSGQAVLVDTRNSFVQSAHRVVAAVGVENLLIVDTDDAVLVASRDRDQEVKAVVEHLRGQGHQAAMHHRTVHRPWGRYTELEEADDCRVRRLEVRPGGVLSRQLHRRRSEHWTVLSGVARVELDEQVRELQAGATVVVAPGQVHRLENTGSQSLHLVEIQTGEYLGDDDVERFEDYYGSG